VAGNERDFPDVNVWLAMSVTGHEHHARADTYRNTESDRLVFSRITGLGFMRLVSNPQAIGVEALSVSEAWGMYARLLARPNVEFRSEPPRCTNILEKWARDSIFSWQLWTDAYLAAFAVAADIRLVTFDSDFARFPGLSVLHLKP